VGARLDSPVAGYDQLSCADLSDPDYNQLRQTSAGLFFSASGNVFAGNTLIGSANYYDENLDSELMQASFMDGLNLGTAQPQQPMSQFGQAFLKEMGSRMAPLNKVSDCAARAAISNFVPFGDKVVGEGPKTAIDRAKSASDAVDNVGTAAKHSEAISRVLTEIELPNIAAEVAKYGPEVGALAELAGPAGYAISGARAAEQTKACYQGR